MRRIKFLIARVLVNLVDRFERRPCTASECASIRQYAGLMIDTLRGEVSWYGRDGEHEPIISQRRERAS
jgi:hypothetical protein